MADTLELTTEPEYLSKDGRERENVITQTRPLLQPCSICFKQGDTIESKLSFIPVKLYAEGKQFA